MSTATDPLSKLVRDAVISALREQATESPVSKRLMTRDEAADFLAVEPSSVDRLYHLGKIKRVPLSEKLFRYDVRDLEAYIESVKES